jgi:hypothetical protein
MRALDRENGFSPEVFGLRRPAYEPQILANSCWAACLVMWHRSQGLGSITQHDFIASAPTVQVGPDGINLEGLQTVIDDANAVSLVKMGTLRVDGSGDIPNLRRLMFTRAANGHIYLAFARASGLGGHCHVLFGFAVDDFANGLTFDALDPDPGVGLTRTTQGTYFSRFPALAGFRQP